MATILIMRMKLKSSGPPIKYRGTFKAKSFSVSWRMFPCFMLQSFYARDLTNIKVITYSVSEATPVFRAQNSLRIMAQPSKPLAASWIMLLLACFRLVFLLFNAFQCFPMLFNAFQCFSMLFNAFQCFSMLFNAFNAFQCFSMLFNAFQCFQCFSMLFKLPGSSWLLPSPWLSLALAYLALKFPLQFHRFPQCYTRGSTRFNPGLSAVSPEDLHGVPVEKPHEAQRVDQDASDSKARLSP